MKSHLAGISKAAAAAALVAAALTPREAHACACGCGIFDVATSSMLPDGQGGMTFLEFSYQNQYKNWGGSSRSAAANNDDKDISTMAITGGAQYFFNSSWGIQLEVPYEIRSFKTASNDPTTPGGEASLNWNDIGDIRVEGIYTGFSDDLSTGLSFGVKLPSGNFTHNDAFDDVDRDSELGTGSTDLLLGVFHRQHFARHSHFSWFAQAAVDVPVLIQQGYRPGIEGDQALGVYYRGWSWGRLNLSPVAQILASERTSDSGDYASGGIDDGPVGIKNSGYERIYVSPGLEFNMHPFSLYADVELPVYEHVTGNQLVSPALFKVIFSYHF